LIERSWGGSAITGPSFFVFEVYFLFCGGAVVFAGVLRKTSVLVWCFCGEDVVICVADVVF
jgi:hypothetical protein